MPFIDCKLNVDITKQQEMQLKDEFGKAISLIPGKSENWLMVNIQPKCSLYFRGSNDKPIAMITVMVYGTPNPAAYDALTARFNNILKNVANVEDMYVSYSETSNFGYNRSNF